jgi:chemotaxis protein MotB
MMSLLLTFFILLAAMSEIKKEDEYREIAREVQKAFGIKHGGGMLPSRGEPKLSFIRRLMAMSMISRKEPRKSNARDPGIEGVQRQVTSVRQEERQAVGGRITFEPGSVELGEAHRRELVQLAALIRGYGTKVLIDGHADTGEPLAGTPHRDLWDLSYARAKAVGQYLSGPECRIRPERIKVSGNADSEKLKWSVLGAESRRTNRRVEVQVSDHLVDELTGPEMESAP